MVSSVFYLQQGRVSTGRLLVVNLHVDSVWGWFFSGLKYQKCSQGDSCVAARHRGHVRNRVDWLINRSAPLSCYVCLSRGLRCDVVV